MNNIERSHILINNYKKAVSNLSKRIATLEKALKKVEYSELIEIIKESIVHTNEVTVELAWKTARTLSIEFEPSNKIAGSTTAIKHALKTEVIKNDNLARSLLEAIQDRNVSSHEYLLEKGLDKYVDNIITVYYPIYLALIKDYTDAVMELEI